MDFIELFLSILSIIIGYLLGGILPAFLFGKLKGIDLREEGTKNPGTLNAFRILGIKYAIPIAIFDTLKGLVAMLVAYSLEVNFFFMQLSAIAAIIGHIFPYYLNFRGGQGVATSTGLLLFYLVRYMALSLEIFFVMLYLLFLVILFVYICKMGSLLSLIIFPILGFSAFQIYPTSAYNLFFILILIHIASVGLYEVISKKKIKIEDETFRAHWWRVVMRPFAIIFVIFYVFNPKIPSLILIGSVALAFIILDLVRFIHKQTNELLTKKVKSIFKKGEINKFSSMTVFLVAGFISILVYEKNIAIASLIFLIFGDIFGKIFGLAFGKHKIFDKTLEGTLAYYGSVLICGYFIFFLFDIPLIVLVCGGAMAPIIELFSFGVDDNFTVPILSGAIMAVVQLFIAL
ncbi:MAG: glycerol-3-phosphate acyltransferase [Candidatus Odinarchaeota archaeon]